MEIYTYLKKDHQKVRDFIQAVRETDKELTS